MNKNTNDNIIESFTTSTFLEPYSLIVLLFCSVQLNREKLERREIKLKIRTFCRSYVRTCEEAVIVEIKRNFAFITVGIP